MISLYSAAKRLGIAEALKSRPLLYFFLRDVLGRLELFLPLEPDFWAFQALPAGEGLFVDIGANDGISARSFRKVNAANPILSIEPNAAHRPALDALKSRLPRFDYLILGLGDAPGSARLFNPVYKGKPLTSFASLDPDVARSRAAGQLGLSPEDPGLVLEESQTRLATLDSLDLAPAYIKIDVEGHGAAVFRGMAETVRRHRPVVMSEYVPSEWAETYAAFPGQRYGTWVFDYPTRRFSRLARQAPDNVFLVPQELEARLPMDPA